jgi:transglutaminase-like putative cysteine protease
MSRLRIVHRTGFEYHLPAHASYNEARMLPLTDHSQYVISARLDITPATGQHSYIDYWGTQVSVFEVLVPHRELAVTATSVVDVRENRYHPVDTTWEFLESARDSSSELAEALLNTRLSEPHSEVAKMAKAIKDTGAGPAFTAMRIAQTVNEHMNYVRGSTGVHSTAKEAWSGKSGVCQDFAHVTIGALRSVGIPARYVSGYLHPNPNAAIGEPVVGESHAWVEWYTGGWYGFDPTNLSDISTNHVQIARGRDYLDVAPLHGVYSGEGGSVTFVSVEITREA